MPDEEPKIIVDSDWKVEAHQEKEKLAAEAESEDRLQPMPEANFFEIINLIAMQAVIGLGGMKMPDGRDVPADMGMAKHHIDLLETLQKKTSGQLNDQEQKVLDATLHELRLGFVQATAGGAPPQPDNPK